MIKRTLTIATGLLILNSLCLGFGVPDLNSQKEKQKTYDLNRVKELQVSIKELRKELAEANNGHARAKVESILNYQLNQLENLEGNLAYQVKIDLIKSCYDNAEKSLKTKKFKDAAKYLNKGYKLLGKENATIRRTWQSHFDKLKKQVISEYKADEQKRKQEALKRQEELLKLKEFNELL